MGWNGVTRGNGGYPGCVVRWHVIRRFIHSPGLGWGFDYGKLSLYSDA